MEQWIEKVRASEPNNPNVLCAVGAYYVQAKKDTQQATKTFERVIEIDHANAFALATVAASYGSANRMDEAVRLSKQALELQPKCAAAVTNIGMAEMARKEFDKAEEYFRKATDLESAGSMDWFNRGSFYYFRKDLKQAKECLLKAVELSPRMLEAHHNLAGVMYGLGSKEECVKHLRLVVEIDPTSPYASKARQNLRALGY